MKEIYVGPVSVKGIIFENGKVWLRKNERNEWELPGGKMDYDEQPEVAVVREIREELGFEIRVISLVNAHRYVIKQSVDENQGVFVVSYLCELIKKVGEFEVEGEAGSSEFCQFDIEKVNELKMPEFYKIAINDAKQITNPT